MVFPISLILINALSFLLMRTDKFKAKHHQFRTPEALLFLSALVGGSLECLMGMYIYRHKTRKPLFSVGVPLVFLAQLILVLSYCR